MLAGGGGDTDHVELISLDPVNHPVPLCLRTLATLPVDTRGAAGAALTQGTSQIRI